MNLLDGNGKNALQNFKNPFDKDGVEYVVFKIHRTPSIFRNDKKGEATVYFNKGNTDGSQKFYSDEFKDLVNQVDNFINSL